MVSADLAALIESNAWTYGPNATALRILRMTRAQGGDPIAPWEPILAQCPRLTPLGYWREALRQGGRPLDGLEADFLRREELLVEHLGHRLRGHARVLLAGHDREIEQLWLRSTEDHVYRYLLLDGPKDADSPGGFTRRRMRPTRPVVAAPFPFERLEEALDWADAVVLSGFTIHRQNLLGPPQVRTLLASAREQAEVVLLCATNERRVSLGEGAPRLYTDDFRPYLWQSSVTHLVSEWHQGTENTNLGWLPMPPDVLRDQFGEVLFPS